MRRSTRSRAYRATVQGAESFAKCRRLAGDVSPRHRRNDGLNSRGKTNEADQLKVFGWDRLLAGILAAAVVFCTRALWVLFHYDTSPTSVLTVNALVENVVRSSLFWLLSIAAFGVSYYLAR
jgi:hypothetical protein